MSDPLPQLETRDSDAHKGDFGRALLIGGSRGMTGAIALAGTSALRSGAGLVTLGVPDPCVETVAAIEPSYMTVPLPANEYGQISGAARDDILRHAQSKTALAFGPGLGQADELRELAAWLYTNLPQPIVIDADGLNVLAGQDNVLRKAAGPRILTPHPGELARLMGGNRQNRDRQIEAAVALAMQCEIIVVLKGHRTLITDGHEQHFNETGNPGMATGGSGDVLTGVVTGLLCQGLSPLNAARLGVHVHGRAGDLATAETGQVSMIASDLIDTLPWAFRELGAEQTNEGQATT